MGETSGFARKKYFGDPWMSDPACYLTNKEISKEVTEQVEAMEDDVLLVRAGCVKQPVLGSES